MEPFCLSAKAIRSVIKDFHSEMRKGLCGGKSSLSMIPAFAGMPAGNEKGAFIALDLGGTNFRVMGVALNGRGRISVTSEKRFRLKNKDITGTEKQLFDFIALSVKRFMLANRIGSGEARPLGFTFSFPMRQRSITDGILLRWNKGFRAKNAVGRDVARLLNNALKRIGARNIEVAALINDTVGTLVTGRYSDRNCDLGVIIGTGTNASYPEKISNIKKVRHLKTRTGQMAVNIEWGNFNRLPRTTYDRKLDASTANPGRQILEKMVSGMYLGEISRLVLLDLIRKKTLFSGKAPAGLARPWKFNTSQVALAEGDRSKRLDKIGKLLKELDKPNSSYSDRLMVKKVCGMVSARSAQISSAVIAAVILWMDPKVKNDHAVAIDGSLFEKWPDYRRHIRSSLRNILKEKAVKVSLALIKNGSGKGAAVAAAASSRE